MASLVARNVTVSASRIHGSDQHVEYEISIDGNPSIWRRYREFDDLCSHLKKEGVAMPRALPPKRLFGGNTSFVIAERKAGLDAWLTDMIRVVRKSSRAGIFLVDFLRGSPWIEAQPSLNGSASKALVTNPTETKLRDIVARFTAATAASSPYGSLLGISGGKLKDNDIHSEDFDLATFRRSLENATNVFIMLKRPARV